MTWRNLPTKLLSPKTAIRIATWNVQTMYETGKAAKLPERWEGSRLRSLDSVKCAGTLQEGQL